MEEKHILPVLKRSHEESLMVSVYSDRNEPEAFSAGFIDALSAGQFVMKHVTPEGIQDGYIIRRTEDVFRVDVGGEYERRLELLYTLQKQRHEDFITGSVEQASNLFKESPEIAQRRNAVVTVCIDETESQDEIKGFVKSVNSGGVTISRISHDGSDDGESTFFSDDIVKINCDTADEKILKLLFDHRHK